MTTIRKTTKAILDHLLPPERHQDVTVKLGERGGYSIYAKKGDPLDRYFYTMEAITEDQYRIGRNIGNWARTSQIYAPTGMQLNPMTGCGKREMTEMQVMAWQSYFKVMAEIQRVHGLKWVHAIRDICVMGETLESRKDLKWRERKVAPLANVLQDSFMFWKQHLQDARQSAKN